MNSEENDSTITIRLPASALKDLDELRRTEKTLPTRAGMLRLLIERATAALERKQK